VVGIGAHSQLPLVLGGLLDVGARCSRVPAAKHGKYRFERLSVLGGGRGAFGHGDADDTAGIDKVFHG